LGARSTAGLLCLLVGVLVIITGLYWSIQFPHDVGDVAKVAKGWIDGWIAVGVGTFLVIVGAALLKGSGES